MRNRATTAALSLRTLLPTVVFALALLATLALFPAQAQATTAPEPSIGGGLLGPLLPTLFGLLSTGGIYVLGIVSRLVLAQKDRTKIKVVQDLLTAIWPVVSDVVTGIWLKSTSLLKAASSDGTLTQDESTAAFSTAVKEVWATLPAVLKALLAKYFGGEAQAQAQAVGPLVEQALKTAKATTVSPTLGKPTQLQLQAARARIGLSTGRLSAN